MTGYASNSANHIHQYLDSVLALYGATLTGVLATLIYLGRSMLRTSSTKAFSSTLVSCSGLELWWTVAPTTLLVISTAGSISLLYGLEPDRYGSSATAEVVGLQWYWEHASSGACASHSSDICTRQSTSGVTAESRLLPSGELPKGTPRLTTVTTPLWLETGSRTTLRLTSADVLHSWSVPALGVKLDAIPGRVTSGSLAPTLDGCYVGYCSELCGIGHAVMPINVVAYTTPQSATPP